MSLKASENLFVFCFQEYRYIENIGLKWVSLYNYKSLESKQIDLFCFHPFEVIYHKDVFLYPIK